MPNENPADPAPVTLTPEQATEMEQQLAQYHAQQAAEAAADRAARIQPLTDLFASDGWAQLRTVLGATTNQMIDEPFFDSLRALDTITKLLPGLVR